MTAYPKFFFILALAGLIFFVAPLAFWFAVAIGLLFFAVKEISV
jgi:hypothetical protein